MFINQCDIVEYHIGKYFLCGNRKSLSQPHRFIGKSLAEKVLFLNKISQKCIIVDQNKLFTQFWNPVQVQLNWIAIKSRQELFWDKV